VWSEPGGGGGILSDAVRGSWASALQSGVAVTAAGSVAGGTSTTILIASHVSYKDVIPAYWGATRKSALDLTPGLPRFFSALIPHL